MAEVPFVYNKTIYNPTVSFGYKLGCLYPGRVIFISGIPFKDTKRFTVDLSEDKSSIPFHVDIRFNIDGHVKTLVRNTMNSGAWGEEEKYLNEPFPFAPDQFFEMAIYVGKSCFMVSLNDEQLFEYKHRVPMEKVKQIEIHGDIRLTKVAIHG